jgi:homoserine dehydrogenase
MEKVTIGVLGFGTVGTGVVKTYATIKPCFALKQG